MDDIFNPTPATEPEKQVADSEEKKTEPTVNEQVFQPTTQPQQPNPPYNAPAYNQPQSTGYTAPYNTNPYGAPSYQPATPTSPQNTMPPFVNPGISVTKAQKNKKNWGKILFIALICICIVCSSVAIGLSTGKDNDKPQNPSTILDGEKPKAEGAKPNTEDSPISYSKYSGKGPMSAEQIYEAVKDTNVGVLVYSQNQMVGEGSGIIVGEDKSGKYTYILTAAHVIDDKNVDVQIQFSDETEKEAVIIGVDAKTDIGVVMVEKSGLKAATFGNSDKLSVGQKVFAIGNPGGTEFFGSFTSGMISAIDRPVPSANSSYDLPCIQHNAAINPGNSGGALVNEYGQVIGLNSSKISSTEYEGMGFAVPAATVLEVYNELIVNGYVSNRPILGISYFPVSSDYSYATVAWRNNLPYGSIAIAAISESSDMNNHGIKVGDVITAVNGKKMDTVDVLLEAIENANVGDKLTLTIYRLNSNGTVNKTFNVKVKLIEDTGTNSAVVEESTEEVIDPFSYFEGFGY